MTTREKYLIVAGIVLGLLVASMFFGMSRLIRPEATAAKEELAPFPSGSTSEDPPAQHGGHEHSAAAESEPLSSLQLTEDEQRSIGLQTTVVQRRSIHRELLAAARVEEPETQLANISARIGGRLDKLYVDFTGQPVRRGQPIAEIYSPEVLTSAEEYKLALENRKRLGSNAESQALSAADELITASRRRLELWGLTSQQIDTIASSDKPQIDLMIYSPAGGIVSERKVTQGQYVNTGDVLYTVTDLSTVWVKADVYETDVPQVRVGQSVEITSESIPGNKLHGRVGFLEPMVNAQTRTTAARIQVANPGMRLRPGMFVQARFALGGGESVLAVTRSAVVNTGEHKLVYVAKGDGVFEAHEVQLGAAAGDYFPVLSGLRGGERIVTEGNFLLDSQTRITGGMSGMFGGSKEFNQQPSAPESAQWKISFRSDPATPRGDSEATAYVSVQDNTGKPVTDAQVKVTLFMPAMPAMRMSEMRETAALGLKGTEYAGTIKIPTSGTWAVTVEVRRRGQLLTSYRTSLSAK
ncbi:MAG: efflux RND transporter periplasmic adaptor subunit [Acidobacteriia bacterium]|nr:efflux RND transporter periplasmic adaptor subunit [Terriglobia bacterium]